MPVEVYFGWGIQVCYRSVVFRMCEHFRPLWFHVSLYVGLDYLFDPPLCMGMAMFRAAQKYVGT